MDREESFHLIVIVLFISGPVEPWPRRASGAWGRSPNYYMHVSMFFLLASWREASISSMVSGKVASTSATTGMA